LESKGTNEEEVQANLEKIQRDKATYMAQAREAQEMLEMYKEKVEHSMTEVYAAKLEAVKHLRTNEQLRNQVAMAKNDYRDFKLEC
jgi:hypothetical protein